MTESPSLEELQQQIQELKNNLPAHSVPANMLLELEDLEEKLAALINPGEGDSGAST